MIYDVKHNRRHKSRLVAGGHLTDPNTESVYSGADVGNAYLESRTKEQVYIIGGPEFWDLEGHTLLIDNALHSLRCYG
jgi:hypothetical protein